MIALLYCSLSACFPVLQKICLNFRVLFDWLWMTGNLKRASSSWKERTKRTMSLFSGDLSKNFFFLVLNFVFFSSLNMLSVLSYHDSAISTKYRGHLMGRGWGGGIACSVDLFSSFVPYLFFVKELSLKLISFPWNIWSCSVVLQTPWRPSVFLYAKERAIQICKFWTRALRQIWLIFIFCSSVDKYT